MIVLKDDRVQTKTGDTGQVIDIWGVARTLLRLRRESDGQAIIIFEHDVSAILERRREPRTKWGKGVNTK